MSKYETDDTMKQVIIYGLDETLNEHHDYTEQEVKSLLTKMGVKARSRGYKDVTYSFESTMEPYEDYLGSPMLRIKGWTPKTKEDLKVQADMDEQKDLAKQLGCTFYEAGQVIALRRKGVID